MNRQVVAGLLISLVLAGCGPDRALPKRTAPQASPVGMTPPMDSIHTKINGPNGGSPETGAGAGAVASTTASAKEGAAGAAGPPADASLAGANPAAGDSILPSPLAAEWSPESRPVSDPAASIASAGQAEVTQGAESTRRPIPRVGSDASVTDRDPLLGANPDMMPIFNDSPTSAKFTQTTPPFKQNIPDILVPDEKSTASTAIAPEQAAHPSSPATIPDIAPGSIENNAPPSPIELVKESAPASIPNIVPHSAGTPEPSTTEPVKQPLLDRFPPPPAIADKPPTAKEAAPPGEILPKLPTDLVMPEETPIPAGTGSSPPPAGASAPQAASNAGDPLLGATPNLMPILEPASDPGPSPVAAGRLGAAPSVRDIATKPAAGPAPAPAPAAAPESSVLPTLDLPASARPPGEVPAAAPKPLPTPKPMFMPAKPGDTVDPPAPSPSASKPTKTEEGKKPAATADASEPPSKLDPEVKTAALDPATVHSELPSRVVFSAGRAVAKVGNEIITRRELDFAQREFLKSIPAQDRNISRDERVLLAQQSLNKLIERSVVNQEAKRTLKDPKRIKSFLENADKVWMDEELPPLLRKTGSVNIHELKAKMERDGESLDDARESYRQDFLAKNFLQMKLIPRMKVELPEMRKYYDEHLSDFNVPAEVAWREILIEVGKSASPEDARRKAESILERLKRGEDFARLAQAESDGPNKAEGGLWKLEPRSYAVPTVTSALETLTAGEISGVLDGPKSFHIVRVESRRPAGPESFAAVQDKIRQTLYNEKVHKESTVYLESLRNKTVVINYVEQGMFGKTAATQ